MRLHLTNARGAGVVQLMNSLLPEFDELGCVTEVWLPNSGLLSDWQPIEYGMSVRRYSRRLPNAVSRCLEVTVFSYQFDGDDPLIVFGDIPLRVACRQTLFFQNALLLSATCPMKITNRFIWKVSRLLLRANLKFVDSVIVQTHLMRDMFVQTFPSYSGSVHVLSQPAQRWLLVRERRRWESREVVRPNRLRLVYPAAWYPHKNHNLLLSIDAEALFRECEIILSLPPNTGGLKSNKAITLVGFLEPDEMIELYGSADGLLFLSSTESYGFPLVEAMYLGLPIVCPDAPYARELCGDKAFFFDLTKPESILDAIMRLRSALSLGYSPDWGAELSKLSARWADVASAIISIASDERNNETPV